MHRIASTGSQEAAGREEIISDLRFQQLVVYVEHNLKHAPETFGEQHLANVVWGAAKLRLQREPLFNLVQREVTLAASMRCLADWLGVALVASVRQVLLLLLLRDMRWGAVLLRDWSPGCLALFFECIGWMSS